MRMERLAMAAGKEEVNEMERERGVGVFVTNS